MTKRSRTILFLICLILFLIITPAVILYSQGYRFDFKTKKITQTGAFYFKAWPKSLEIYINDKFKKKTDFFFGEARLENLLPKKYKIEIKKSGFHPWEKNLEIKEKEVTEAKNVVLFPENPLFDFLDKNIENFFVSADEKKIILKRRPSREGAGWALELFDLEKNVKSHLIEEKDISTKGVDLLSLEFSKDSKEIEIKTKIKKEEKIFGLKIDKIPPLLEERKNSLLPEIKEEFKISPDQKKLIYFSDYEIWVLYLDEAISPFHKKGERVFLLRFSEEIKDLFWLTNHYLIMQVGEKIKISEIDDRDRINLIDLAEFKNPKIFWSTINKKLYLLSEGNLFTSEKLLP